jgi:hypothetical protein
MVSNAYRNAKHKTYEILRTPNFVVSIHLYEKYKLFGAITNIKVFVIKQARSSL